MAEPGRFKMKTLAFLFLWISATLTLSAGPTVSAPAEVRIRDRNFDLVATITDPAEIRSIIDAIRRAPLSPAAGGGAPLSHKLDLNDRCLYDVPSGRLRLLSITVQPTYQLLDPDRALLERIIDGKEK